MDNTILVQEVKKACAVLNSTIAHASEAGLMVKVDVNLLDEKWTESNAGPKLGPVFVKVYEEL